jgi:hypothetical protein
MADNKYFEIPKASVRKIMKLNDEVSNVSGVRSHCECSNRCTSSYILFHAIGRRVSYYEGY